MATIKRALISVSDKDGIIELAQALISMGVEILSTGGTARTLRDNGIAVKDVSEFTGFPEMMDGRVKTLHPKVHGGILNRRTAEDRAEMQANGLEDIDLIVVNLYPFEQTIAKPDVTFDDAIENIDIGGPTMIRAAAKNHRHVGVIVDPEDYSTVMVEMRENCGELSDETRAMLARKVFEHTARYDSMIAEYLTAQIKTGDEYPEALSFSLRRFNVLRYGENPHQSAAAYQERTGGLNLFEAQKLQGLDMSFNNYCDAHNALLLALEFQRPCCTIVKHNNPCGVALGENAAEAYVKAYKTDATSAFGGVVAFNCPVDGDAAREITSIFVEVVIAPEFTDDARTVFSKKNNIRLLQLPDMRNKPLIGYDIKRVAGGLLVQQWNNDNVDIRSLQPVTQRVPTPMELDALEFAWKVAKHVRSNAIVYAFSDRTAGIGMGQTSRVYSARVGAINASESLNGTVVASDGFFPFRDAIDGIKRVGVTALIHPGGSLKDAEIIEAANDNNLAMLMTGKRTFKH